MKFMQAACIVVATAYAVTGLSAPRGEGPAGGQAAMKKPLTTAEVLAASGPADWRPIDPQNTIYMDLPSGRVIIELAPQFAPHYVANVEMLARQGYFNGL
ncbi:MAG TPA: hypothetical protein VN730_08695, partial [Steroidobacteraceae bacterium]|nr:hypothetical protein [Steroidobacteraceae bacterium]